MTTDDIKAAKARIEQIDREYDLIQYKPAHMPVAAQMGKLRTERSQLVNMVRAAGVNNV